MKIQNSLDFYAFYKQEIKCDYKTWFEQVLKLLLIPVSKVIPVEFSDKCDEILYGTKNCFYIRLNEDQKQNLIYHVIKGKWLK